MNRKEAITRTALLIGGVVSIPNILGVLNGCKSRSDVNWDHLFFDTNQAKLIEVLSDIFIPETDTPGASQAGVPAFIEEMIFTGYDENKRKLFLLGLKSFNQLSIESHGKDFIELHIDDQLKFANYFNRHSYRNENTENSAKIFFLNVKELTLIGYFTSEIGAKKTLRYLKIPGRYEGCIPFDKVGKSWAT